MEEIYWNITLLNVSLPKYHFIRIYHFNGIHWNITLLEIYPPILNTPIVSSQTCVCLNPQKNMVSGGGRLIKHMECHLIQFLAISGPFVSSVLLLTQDSSPDSYGIAYVRFTSIPNSKSLVRYPWLKDVHIFHKGIWVSFQSCRRISQRSRSDPSWFNQVQPDCRLWSSHWK